MLLSLFDTHCDTPYEMYKRKEKLSLNTLHISTDKISAYCNYCQCMAIWSDKKRSDEEAYRAFFDICRYFKTECDADPKVSLCDNYADISNAHENGRAAFVLAVEDARLLSNDISRLDVLRTHGVRFLTFQWEGESCIGGGFDTDIPLTPFGRSVAENCTRLGIIPDISHACERTARDIIEISYQKNLPVIATHSNSFSVYPHKRNLSDALYDLLCEGDGIVGISLAPQHLTKNDAASSLDVLSHIEHYAERHGIRRICLGCDFDGIEKTPSDLGRIDRLYNLANAMLSRNYNEDEVRAVFSENARSFFERNLR